MSFIDVPIVVLLSKIDNIEHFVAICKYGISKICVLEMGIKITGNYNANAK